MMREIRQFILDNPACVAIDASNAGELIVMHGLVWATIDGAAEDHWLRAGDALPVTKGCRLWLSAEKGEARLQLSLRTCQRPRAYGKKPLLGVLRGRRGAFSTR